MPADLLIVHPADNVAVALRPLEAGKAAIGDSDTTIDVRQAVPFAHKIALRNIPAGAEIVKHGAPIGIATLAIHAGEHVHTHNVLGLKAAGRS